MLKKRIRRKLKQLPATIGPNGFTHSGFTLIELLVALCIVVILAGTAVPNLRPILNKNAVKSKSILLNASLKLARNHAIVSGIDVYLCAMQAAGVQRCKQQRDYNADWSDGWLVFADTNHDHDYTAGDTLLRVVSDHSQAKVFFNQRGRLRFTPNGGARSAGFYICDLRAEQTRHIQILHSGRTRKIDQLSEKRRKVCAQS